MAVGRSVYGHVITKFSGMGRFTKLWGSAIKLVVFSLGRAVLSRFTQGIDLYTSAKFRAFNTNLNISARFLCHFPVL